MKVVLSHERVAGLDACHEVSIVLYRMAKILATEMRNSDELERILGYLDQINDRCRIIDKVLR